MVLSLHSPRAKPIPALVPLAQWFEALWRAAAIHRGIFEHCASTELEFLVTPRDVSVLHGDIHHGNVLDFGASGWLAIDPKGLYGECGFDYANMFCNPDGETALAPGCFASPVKLAANVSGIDRRRLLQWVFAWTGLSSSWKLEDNDEPGSTLEIEKFSASILRCSS